ncbi:CvpA family protein [Sulfurospirillum cavolei]|uniref:CvpA family protein n=1 Tax=Sulfurospirillum cavolei TaxID=366522 RepID=UPI001E3A1A36|nr:CvpA family protein [Sulfurospirillum cavolei]
MKLKTAEKIVLGVPNNMSQIVLFDIISLALVLILGIKGIINGFIKEFFGLLGIIGGIYFASRYAQEAGVAINTHVYTFGNQASLYLFGFITVLIVFWTACIFLGYLIAHALSLSGLGMLDRLAGFAIGCAKIFLVFSVLAITLNSIEFIKTKIEPYVGNSTMFPLFLETGRAIVKLDTKEMLNSIPLDKQPNP